MTTPTPRSRNLARALALLLAIGATAALVVWMQSRYGGADVRPAQTPQPVNAAEGGPTTPVEPVTAPAPTPGALAAEPPSGAPGGAADGSRPVAGQLGAQAPPRDPGNVTPREIIFHSSKSMAAPSLTPPPPAPDPAPTPGDAAADEREIYFSTSKAFLPPDLVPAPPAGADATTDATGADTSAPPPRQQRVQR